MSAPDRHEALTASVAGGPVERGFQPDIHLFRGVAISFIVMLHSLESFDWSSQPLKYDLLRALLSGSSTLFFFISGYLFQHLSRRFSYRRYLKRKVETVLIPYLIVSIPALVVSVAFIPQVGIWPWFYDLPIASQVGLFLLTGKHLAPLWFVPTMFLFYLSAPLLLWIDRTPRAYWIIPPLLVLAFAIGANGPTGPLHKAIHYLPVYMIGMLVSHHRAAIDRLTGTAILPLLALTVVLFGAMVVDKTLVMKLNTPLKLLNALLIIFILRRWTPPGSPIIGLLATTSFAIYFLHGYVLGGFRLVWPRIIGAQNGVAQLPPSVIGLILHTAIVMALCVGAVKIVQALVPRYSRSVVGA